MQVNVNPSVAAKRVTQFIKTHGGTATHSEALELVAQICGFESYRALKAADTKTPTASPLQGMIRTAYARQGVAAPRPLEEPNKVVFRASAVDWRLADNPQANTDEVPQSHRRRYDVVVEHFGSQLRCLMKPEGVHMDNFEGQPVLDMLLEINEGIPCVHMTNDPADAMCVTVLGHAQGLIVRPDDGEWLHAGDGAVPAELKLAAKAACGSNLATAYVSVLDTASKYAADNHQ